MLLLDRNNLSKDKSSGIHVLIGRNYNYKTGTSGVSYAPTTQRIGWHLHWELFVLRCSHSRIQSWL